MTRGVREVRDLRKVYGMGEATVHALDSRSTEDVLITREPGVGARAKRLIRLVDGQIVDDVRQSPIGSARGYPLWAGTR